MRPRSGVEGDFEDGGIQVGQLHRVRVKRIHSYGVFCELLGTAREGFVHSAELGDMRRRVEDQVKIGDELLVRVVEIDEQGRINLSVKRAQ